MPPPLRDLFLVLLAPHIGNEVVPGREPVCDVRAQAVGLVRVGLAVYLQQTVLVLLEVSFALYPFECAAFRRPVLHEQRRFEEERKVRL